MSKSHQSIIRGFFFVFAFANLAQAVIALNLPRTTRPVTSAARLDICLASAPWVAPPAAKAAAKASPLSATRYVLLVLPNTVH